MKYWKNISGFLAKLLIVSTAVVMLNACSGSTDHKSVIVDSEITEANVAPVILDSKEVRGCLSCVILEDIYDAVSTNVMSMHGHFTSAAMPIMMVGFSIWLALRLLKFVSSVTETNVGEVWNEIVRKAFICLVCGVLASSSGMLLYVMNTLIFPIYYAFLELGVQILQNSLTSPDAPQPVNFDVFGTHITVENIKLNCSVVGDFKATESGFPSSLKETMSCMILNVSVYLSIGADIARQSMQQVESVMGVVMGVVLWIFFWIVKLGFTFYLVDMIFQMGIIILLLPLYVLAYAFGPTREWTKKGFSHILASSAFMMCFSIIVSLVLVAMISLIQQNQTIFNPEDLEANMKDLSIGFMCLLLIGFLIYGSMGVSQQLTSALLGTKVSANFQKNLKAAVQGLGGAILSGLGIVVTWGASLAPQSSIKLIRGIGKAAQKTQAMRAKLHRLAGRK